MTNFYTTTDNVDIRNKQIGVHSDQDAREFCIGVNHAGTKASVHTASQIAEIIERALNAAIESGELTLTKKGK